jgi:hypothetical protein
VKGPTALRLISVSILVAACGGPAASPTFRLPTLPASSGSPPVVTPAAPSASSRTSYGGSLAVLPADPRPDFDREIACNGTIGDTDPVVLVTVPAATADEDEHVELRDLADPAQPRTVCTFGSANGIYDAWLLDARHLVISDQAAEPRALFAVVDLPDVRFRWFELPPGTGWGPELLTVGPNLDRVLWNDVHAGGGDVDEIHLATGDDDQVIATAPDPNQGRCGQASDSSTGRYARTGPEAYVLTQPMDGWQSLIVVDGDRAAVVAAPPSGGWAAGQAPQMAVWSPAQEELFWSQGGDAWRWTPDTGKKRVLRGVTWFDPTISADGRWLAYAAGQDGGPGDLFVWDLHAAGAPKKIASSASSPRFLDATQLWYLTGESMGDCTGTASTPVVDDLRTGRVAASDIPAVLSAWPATSAQN